MTVLVFIATFAVAAGFGVAATIGTLWWWAHTERGAHALAIARARRRIREVELIGLERLAGAAELSFRRPRRTPRSKVASWPSQRETSAPVYECDYLTLGLERRDARS